MKSEEFNSKYEVGTPVIYHPVVGGPGGIETRTRSEAWELSNGRLVVLVEGKQSPVAVAAIRAMEVR